MLRMVCPKPAALTIASCAVMVFGPFWVIQYHRAVCHVTAGSVAARSGSSSRSMPSASPAAVVGGVAGRAAVGLAGVAVVGVVGGVLLHHEGQACGFVADVGQERGRL